MPDIISLFYLPSLYRILHPPYNYLIIIPFLIFSILPPTTTQTSSLPPQLFSRYSSFSNHQIPSIPNSSFFSSNPSPFLSPPPIVSPTSSIHSYTSPKISSTPPKISLPQNE
jgi:hypothetical protein